MAICRKPGAEVPAALPSPGYRYLVGLAAVVAIWAVDTLLEDDVPPALASALLVAAVGAGALSGGLGPALVAGSAAFLVWWELALPPDELLLGAIGLGALLLGFAGESVWRSRRRAGVLAAELATTRRLLEDEAAVRLRAQERFDRLIRSNVVPVVVTDADGHCLQANPAFRELLGAPDDLALEGIQWDALALPGDRLLDERAATDARAYGAASPYERTLVCTDGRRIPVLVGAVAVVPGESALLWFVIDLSTRARLEKERAERTLLDVVFETAPVGFGVFDSELRFLRLNRRLAEINGLPPQEQLGRRMPEVLPQLGPEVQSAFAHVFRTGEAIEGTEVHGRTPASDELRTWEVSFYPVRTGDGPLFGVASVVHDVTERRRAEAEREALLRDAERGRAEAESVSRAKDEFLAVLSHELRAPLQGLLGWLGLLQDGRLDAAQQARAHQAIERSARLQTQLISDLLDASRIVTGTFTLESRPLELSEVVGRVVEQFRPLAAARGIGFESSVSDCGITFGDPERLQQGLANLVSNALKFTPPGGTIAVRCEKQGDEVMVTVTDTGEGIGSQFLPHVFDRFRQADGSRSRRHGGLGLGLAITRDLAELYGGSIALTGSRLGGLCARLQLPT